MNQFSRDVFIEMIIFGEKIFSLFGNISSLLV
jgi:hypothetical protein